MDYLLLMNGQIMSSTSEMYLTNPNGRGERQTGWRRLLRKTSAVAGMKLEVAPDYVRKGNVLHILLLYTLLKGHQRLQSTVVHYKMY